jgi:hypothetical protein
VEKLRPHDRLDRRLDARRLRGRHVRAVAHALEALHASAEVCMDEVDAGPIALAKRLREHADALAQRCGGAVADDALPRLLAAQQRFLTDAVEDLIAETRKFNVSLTLAHQFMSQFGTRKTDALSSVGSTIIFNIDSADAHHLLKDLMGKADVDDLVSLQTGQAIARIDTEVVRVRTLEPLKIQADNCRDQIVAASRKRYYRPADEVRQMIRHRRDRWLEPCPAATSAPADVEELVYDEF